jgi:hypothetical protein
VLLCSELVGILRLSPLLVVGGVTCAIPNIQPASASTAASAAGRVLCALLSVHINSGVVLQLPSEGRLLISLVPHRVTPVCTTTTTTATAAEAAVTIFISGLAVGYPAAQ